MKAKGVLDRIVDGQFATILVEDLGKEFVLNKDQLPPNIKAGDWLDLVIKNDQIEHLALNKKQTEIRKNVVEDKLKKLRSRSRSKFKK